MKGMGKRAISIACLLLLLAPSLAAAEMFNCQLNVNSSDLEGKIEGQVYQYQADLFAGAGFLFSKNDYWVGNVNVTVRDSVLSPALNVGLGLKGIMGRADYDYADFSAYALGFMILGEYDFRKDYTQWPVSISTGFTIAPSVLSFGDTDRYIDGNVTVYGHIMKNAAILVGYRYTDMRFKTRLYRAKKADDAVFIGARFSF